MKSAEGYSWRVPDGFTGSIKVEVIPNLGPFEVEPEPEKEATYTIK